LHIRLFYYFCVYFITVIITFHKIQVMNEEIELIIEEVKERMEKALDHLDHELARLRAGRATPALLDGITVDYYGVNSPLTQVSNINTPDPKSILIQPWEKNMLTTIEKAILAANIGLVPVNNGEVIRINVPPLTEERRHQLVKQVRNEGETAKISVRNSRKWANDELKMLLKEGLPEDVEKDAADKVQEMTHDFTSRIDKIMAVKEKDIMTV
jgi:ribosome recycling factor